VIDTPRLTPDQTAIDFSEEMKITGTYIFAKSAIVWRG
jgi:hypothetical protein